LRSLRDLRAMVGGGVPLPNSVFNPAGFVYAPAVGGHLCRCVPEGRSPRSPAQCTRPSPPWGGH